MAEESRLSREIKAIGEKAREAGRVLAGSTGQQRNRAISLMRDRLLDIRSRLFEVNQAEVEDAGISGLSAPLIKRLTITGKVFDYMLSRISSLIDMEDPVGRIITGHTGEDGLIVEKISVPLGVIALIYESRPNVTSDAASVCLKSGNAVILRGGSEVFRSNILIADAMRDAVRESGLPEDSIQIIREKDHMAVTELLALDRYIDVIIPRGGKDLIRKIAQGTRIPVIKHYEGICHLYIAEDAPLDWALTIPVNSKCQSVEVCNALETLLVDIKASQRILPPLVKQFKENGVELRGCNRMCEMFPGITRAEEIDWSTEYLAPILSVKIVENIQDAVNHINTYGSGHTDGIITLNLETARYFIKMVDSASVLVNASTRLSGGGAYGLGAVVGISTDKLHARGPVGPYDLTSYKWILYGHGHIRK